MKLNCGTLVATKAFLFTISLNCALFNQFANILYNVYDAVRE